MGQALRNGRARAVATATAPVLCAVYTRKSTDEGLDRDFTSLDNQREAAEAFISSQRHAGWTAVPTRYDDGGFSGGNTERPALKRLLADVEAGLVDSIVVYRLDRLSRSLIDFLRIHEFLAGHGAALVSVTESINTSTPHGRMMVNVLLSFAQYERELVAERTRHKIQAARRRGKWTGGRPVLGYDTVPEGGRIAVNPDEAEQVRAIFALYADTPSLVGVAQELNRRGWRQKAWVTKTGRACGGGEWSKPSVRRLLGDPLYVGLQKLGAETFRGEHDAIVPKALFDRVQRMVQQNRSDGGATSRNGQGFLLRGLLRCTACDAAMTPSWTRKGGHLYRYYRCTHAEKNGHAACPTKSVAATKIEEFVVGEIRRVGADPVLQDATFRQALAQVKAHRRGLKAEAKRLVHDAVTVRDEVERLVGAVSRTVGTAGDAIACELGKAQERLAALEARQREVDTELGSLAAQDIDREDLDRAFQAFDPIWDVLLTPERERVLRLLVDRIDYRGNNGKLAISWRLAGLGDLADELTGGAS